MEDQVEASSGAETEADVSGGSSPASSDVTADSSTAEGAKTAQDAVLAALTSDEESPASDESGTDPAKAEDVAKDEKGAKDEGDKADEDEISPEDLNRLNAKTRKRIDTLLTERREMSGELSSVKAELDKLKPDAEAHKQVRTFLSESNLSAKDAGTALQLAAALVNDPEAAYAELQKIMASLETRIGAKLPDDLAEDVRLGHITEARARELSRARAGQNMAAQRAEQERTIRQREADEQRKAAEAEAQQKVVRDLAVYGDELTAQRVQSDPDWKLKQPLVVDRLKLDIAENGMPKDRADFKKRFDTAVKSATEFLQTVNPTRPRRTVVPNESAGSTGQNTAPPKSAQEAVLRALN